MTVSDILAQLNLAMPNLTIEKAKTMRDNDRALLVTTANGKEFVFTYVSPGVWDICSVKYYKRRTKQ
jgi:hypothetical protein